MRKQTDYFFGMTKCLHRLLPCAQMCNLTASLFNPCGYSIPWEVFYIFSLGAGFFFFFYFISLSCMFTEILSKRSILKEVLFLPLLPRPQSRYLQHSYDCHGNTAYILHCTVHTSSQKKKKFCVIYFLHYYAASINILSWSLLMLQQKQVLTLFSSCVRGKMTTSAFISGEKLCVVFNVCVDTTSSQIHSGQSLHILSTKLQAIFLPSSPLWLAQQNKVYTIIRSCVKFCYCWHKYFSSRIRLFYLFKKPIPYILN